MTNPEEQALLDARETDVVDRLATQYTPPPLTPAERVRFDASLHTRLERHERFGLMRPLFAATAAAALAWVVFSLLPSESEIPLTRHGDWESDLFLSSDISPLEDREESEALPDDYLAIASLFLDG
jgi:hypothetical protein